MSDFLSLAYASITSENTVLFRQPKVAQLLTPQGAALAGQAALVGLDLLTELGISQKLSQKIALVEGVGKDGLSIPCITAVALLQSNLLEAMGFSLEEIASLDMAAIVAYRDTWSESNITSI